MKKAHAQRILERPRCRPSRLQLHHPATITFPPRRLYPPTHRASRAPSVHLQECEEVSCVVYLADVTQDDCLGAPHCCEWRGAAGANGCRA